jgi:hypothetical protein
LVAEAHELIVVDGTPGATGVGDPPFVPAPVVAALVLPSAPPSPEHPATKNAAVATTIARPPVRIGRESSEHMCHGLRQRNCSCQQPLSMR